MVQGDPAHLVGDGLEEALPVLAQPVVDPVRDPGEQLRDDALEQVLAAPDVAVERHGLEAQPLGEVAHREARRPALVDEAQRGVHDLLAVETPALG